MTAPISRLGIALLLAVSAGAGQASAQPQASPEDIVDLNDGIRAYLQGHFEPDPPIYYEEAIERLTAVLERSPDHTTARLFRALSYGQIALIQRAKKDEARDEAAELDQSRQVLDDPTKRERLLADRDRVHARLEEPELDPAERLRLESERTVVNRTVDFLERYESLEPEELENAIVQANARVGEAVSLERQNYAHMLDDARLLVDSLETPDTVLGLLQVIALTKISRLDEIQAFDIKRGAPGAATDGLSPSRLRRAAAANLESAARVLEGQLAGQPINEETIRSRFFLGVIRFRQAVPRRTPDEDPEHDLDRLAQAEALMAELSDWEGTDRRWRSYAELYLGLISAERGANLSDAEQRRASFEAARIHLDRAADLDLIEQEGAAPRSQSNIIPYIVWRQLDLIESYEEAEPAPRYRHDLRLSVQWGAHYDTNVVLLGERTDLPRDIPTERDFGFTLGSVIDYTVDLGTLDDDLKSWSLGLQGRVGQIWHVEIDEFDEQNYGGSAALQYELLPEKETFGPVHLRLQYDYDYALLGRSAFVESQTLTPNVRVYALKRRATTDLFFSYSIRDYREPLFDKRFNRDGEYYRIGLMQSLQLVDLGARYESAGLPAWGLASDDGMRQEDPDYPARYLLPYIGLRYGWDSTEGDEFDQKAYTLTCGAQAPLPYGLTLDAAADFEWQEYAHGSLIDYHRRGRRDFVQRYSVALSRTFVLRGGTLANRYELEMDRVLLTVRAHGSWTFDDSNVVDRQGESIFEYDRAIYGLSFGFTFN